MSGGCEIGSDNRVYRNLDFDTRSPRIPTQNSSGTAQRCPMTTGGSLKGAGARLPNFRFGSLADKRLLRRTSALPPKADIPRLYCTVSTVWHGAARQLNLRS